MSDGADGGFGNCCETMAGVLAEEAFDPLFVVEDGVLFLAIGAIPEETDDEEAGLVEHPVFFCPFCGKKVQDEAEVTARLEGV